MARKKKTDNEKKGEMVGSKKDDVIIGSDFADKILGLKGNDVLIGAKGDDYIDGGKGNDYISGNQGTDILTGGKGADIFVFDGNFDEDTVTDFDVSEGDSLEFVVYVEGVTEQSIIDRAFQDGKNVVIEMGDNEVITLQNFDLAELTTDVIDIFTYV